MFKNSNEHTDLHTDWWFTAKTRTNDEDIVKISLGLDMSKIDNHVLEVILHKYIAEIIGNDIFIKVSLVLAYTTTHSYYLLNYTSMTVY